MSSSLGLTRTRNVDMCESLANMAQLQLGIGIWQEFARLLQKLRVVSSAAGDERKRWSLEERSEKPLVKNRRS